MPRVIYTTHSFAEKAKIRLFRTYKIHQTLDKLITEENVKGQRNNGRINRTWEKDVEDIMGGKCLESGTNITRSAAVWNIRRRGSNVNVRKLMSEREYNLCANRKSIYCAPLCSECAVIPQNVSSSSELLIRTILIETFLQCYSLSLREKQCESNAKRKATLCRVNAPPPHA